MEGGGYGQEHRALGAFGLRDLDRAFDEVRSILAAERLKRERQPGLSAFVRRLQAEL